MLATETSPPVLASIATAFVDLQHAVDTEEVRSGIAARLSDEHDEVRAEAILALATRRDPRALAPLKHELREWPEWDHCLEAAARLGSPELYPLLNALLRQYPEEAQALAAAIDACGPSNS